MQVDVKTDFIKNVDYVLNYWSSADVGIRVYGFLVDENLTRNVVSVLSTAIPVIFGGIIKQIMTAVRSNL